MRKLSAAMAGMAKPRTRAAVRAYFSFMGFLQVRRKYVRANPLKRAESDADN
jgi:hypothetical protein